MSPCPRCGLPATHVGVVFPYDDPQGEVQVIHRCANHSGGSFDFNETASDPLGLLGKVMDTQLRARRLAVSAAEVGGES